MHHCSARLLLLLFVFTGLCRAQPALVDGYAATVRDRVITVGDVHRVIRPMLERIAKTAKGNELLAQQAQLFREGLRSLVIQALILESFEDLGAQLPDANINQRFEDLLRENFKGDLNALHAELRRMGMTEAQWREQIRDQMIVESMTNEMVHNTISISPGQIRERYLRDLDRFTSDEEVRFRVIAFQRDDSATNRVEELTRLYRLQIALAGGADFAEAARTHSTGFNAAEGGDQGWRNPKVLLPELREALASMKVGEVSDLVSSPAHDFILKLEERRGGETRPIAEVQDEIRSEIRRELFEERYGAWIKSLEEKLPVHYYLNVPAASR